MQLKNAFINTYLEYIEETESPRLFHIWSALSGISACLGRRVHLDFGIAPIFANQFVVLVGPPAVRKNTAINIMQRLLKEATGIRFAPDDTGGKRQGLITAIQGEVQDENADVANILLNGKGSTAEELMEEFGAMKVKIDSRDEHYLYAVATEFASFTGMNELNMITFLNKLWDGEDYRYQLKKENFVLANPLLGLLGASTPSNIADSLPPSSIGQGFTSRIIFVYANEKHKSIPRPAKLPARHEKYIKELYGHLYYNFDGQMRETPEATEAINANYEKSSKLNDPRFVYYQDRRQQHLIKLAITLAASRCSNEITHDDIQDADIILCHTEVGMPEALGEFGLSPASVAKQKMVEFLQHCRGPVTGNVLWAVMSRDMKHIDFQNALIELHNIRRITRLQNEDSGTVYVYNDAKMRENADLWQHLTGEEMQ